MKISGQGAPGTDGHPRLDDRGYILVVLLIAMGVTAIWMSAALPAWRQQAMREKEIELIFRGEQYARAIALFQIKNNSYPVDIDILVSQRYLRKKWKDPVTGEDFQLVGLTSGLGGTMGQGGPGASNRTGVGPGTTGVNPNRQGAASPASPTSPATAGRPGASTSGMGTAQAPPGGLSRPSGGVPGGQPSIGNQPLTGGITGVRSVSQATSIRVYNGQQQHNLWQFDAAMMMARMGRNQIPSGGGPGRGNDGRGGPARGGPAGGVPGGRGSGTGPGRGGQLPPPPPPPPTGPGRGAGS